MKIYCGDYELIESKTVIQIENEPIVIILEDSSSINLTLEFHFSDDLYTNSADTRFKLEEDKKLIINVINLTKSINGGLVQPAKVGTFKGRELFITYRVFSFAETKEQKTFIFNAYLKKQNHEQ